MNKVTIVVVLITAAIAGIFTSSVANAIVAGAMALIMAHFRVCECQAMLTISEKRFQMALGAIVLLAVLTNSPLSTLIVIAFGSAFLAFTVVWLAGLFVSAFMAAVKFLHQLGMH